MVQMHMTRLCSMHCIHLFVQVQTNAGYIHAKRQCTGNLHPVTLDSTIHWVNLYTVDKYQGNRLHYLLDSAAQCLNNQGLEIRTAGSSNYPQQFIELNILSKGKCFNKNSPTTRFKLYLPDFQELCMDHLCSRHSMLHQPFQHQS